MLFCLKWAISIVFTMGVDICVAQIQPKYGCFCLIFKKKIRIKLSYFSFLSLLKRHRLWPCTQTHTVLIQLQTIDQSANQITPNHHRHLDQCCDQITAQLQCQHAHAHISTWWAMDLKADAALSLLWFAELTCLTALNVSRSVMTCLGDHKKGQIL